MEFQNKIEFLESGLVLGDFRVVADEARSACICLGKRPVDSPLLQRLLAVTIQALVLSNRNQDVEPVLLEMFEGLHNIPIHPFLLWQLLLVEQGLAAEAKCYLESCIGFKLKAASTEDHSVHRNLQGGNLEEIEMLALCRCYLLDVLCNELKQWTEAEEWLKQQHKSLSKCLSENYLLQLTVQVHKRQPDVRGSSVETGLRSDGVVSASDVFTMMGEFSESEWNDPQLSDAVKSQSVLASSNVASNRGNSAAALATSPKEVKKEILDKIGSRDNGDFLNNKIGQGVRGSATFPSISKLSQGAMKVLPSTERLAGGGPSSLAGGGPSSSQAPLAGGGPSSSQAPGGAFLPYVLFLNTWLKALLRKCYEAIVMKKGWASLGKWKQNLSKLLSVLLLYALVAERKALVAVVKAWWRHIRMVLRTMVSELLSMGLTLIPSQG